jgi:hypothetical protein
MKTMNSDPVQDYILEDEDKLRIAAAVFDAWSEVREKLVSAFLDRLQSRLKEKLKGWEELEFDRWGDPFKNGEAGFDFGKAVWKKAYYVGLHFWDYGHEVVFGLGREEDKEHIKKRDPELLAAIRKRYESARDKRWWEAKVRMQPPSDDWTKPEVLWRMRDENDEFLDEVAEQLLEVANISARFVDQLAGKK